MHAAALFAALLYAVSGFAPLPVVEQDCELISVAHLPDGDCLFTFWGTVQGEFSVLATRSHEDDMAVRWTGSGWELFWRDENYGTEDPPCYRRIVAEQWVESREQRSPMAEHNARPWFRQLTTPGLKSPPKAPQAN